VRFEYSDYSSDFRLFETIAVMQPDRSQPKLSDSIALSDVNMDRFVSFVAKKEKFIPVIPKYGWHGDFI
jgi:hypothetical protein